eukprot:364178-Chlamydomonas_euryale.AAC.1
MPKGLAQLVGGALHSPYMQARQVTAPHKSYKTCEFKPKNATASSLLREHFGASVAATSD